MFWSGIVIRKKDLIALIQSTETFTNPKLQLEQYTIDAACAVDIVFFAGIEFDDINGKLILDIGSGTGRLSIASAYLKAHTILSLDIDIDALEILRKNITSLDLNNIIFPICTDIRLFNLSNSILSDEVQITTIMNPPFGVQERKADRAFLNMAFSISDVIYSIHLSNRYVRKFIKKYASKFDWNVDFVLPYTMILEKTYPFHDKSKKEIVVDVYRFKKNRV
ncbi:MAG: methyltransferase [Candidatus Lokiarchaeota archaeon]|nr:methyltransferase [Candidatus Lokiarchaeota archaeon]MBD3202354.1 methyltransferase [Candidatus Lokiarchaeota archaeon]